MEKLTTVQFQQLMQTHSDALLRLAFLYVKDWGASEDIVQEVFIKFYERSEQFEERASIKTYLTRMTINQCKDYLKSWRYRTHILTNAFFGVTKEKNRMIANGEKLQLAEAILKLPIQYREVIIFYYFEELSIINVAKTLSLSDNTVKTRLRRARELLKKELAEPSWEVLMDE